jgi:hypothetical protein
VGAIHTIEIEFTLVESLEGSLQKKRLTVGAAGSNKEERGER